jgi:hypothetical protein
MGDQSIDYITNYCDHLMNEGVVPFTIINNNYNNINMP